MKRTEVESLLKSMRKVGQLLASINESVEVDSLNVHTAVTEDGMSVTGYAVDDDEMLLSFNDFLGKEVEDE